MLANDATSDLLRSEIGHRVLAGSALSGDFQVAVDDLRVVALFHEDVARFRAQLRGEMGELTGGTMQAVLSDVYASDHGAVALYTAKAARNGKTVNDKFALVFQLMDGKAMDIDDVPLDGEVNDAFWE